MRVAVISTLGLALMICGQARQAQRAGVDDQDLPEKEETRRSFTLQAGALVNVSAINGSVDIQSSNGSIAEVHVVRSARTKEDLEYHKIIVEQTAEGLVVRGENERGDRGRGRKVSQRVSLRVPRQVNLKASGINGRVVAGPIEGSLEASGINGRVNVAEATGSARLSGINGTVTVNMVRLSSEGIRINGVNGGVELRFGDEVNADLNVTGTNGKVSTDLPTMVLDGKIERQNFRARIGAGGPPINVSGVNGRVVIGRAGAR